MHNRMSKQMIPCPWTVSTGVVPKQFMFLKALQVGCEGARIVAGKGELRHEHADKEDVGIVSDAACTQHSINHTQPLPCLLETNPVIHKAAG